ncbi:hypothetical protein PTSG_00685 [Salpingoeca rosetta]|uniref:sphinganine-1-phosphate aldolase n=1 Tax=Salpingoeca rosetta (strain ATCC 50818 / BSB-021) TaxID=946362 RepID=F2TX68_SALR5|nr:uncharacterized protein PTSG_00685 [Salpingoeca rosetta]EGD75977.1 hypothetical protein PTSG_00685 [Salpingoeca rosetta]|eukprot:XP_004998152.1 hypothetical protein PTSG_00685 [Salpingoeca rosetta]
MWTSLAVVGAAAVVGVCQTKEMAEQCTEVFDTATTTFNSYAAPYEAWQVAALAIAAYVLVAKLFVFLFADDRSWFLRLKLWVFRVARKIPFVRSKIASEVEETLVGVEHDMFKYFTHWKANRKLPTHGLTTGQVLAKLNTLRELGAPDKRHAEGKVSGTIYVGGESYEEYTKMITTVYGMFAWTNPLHSGVFPGIRQMEAEIVRMCCTLFHGDESTCGAHTSGGTESIILAIRAYKEYFAEKKGITKPNVVVTRTAHPAFDKACDYFGISLRKADEDKTTRQAIPSSMARLIDSNTIAIVGSCPQYPHGAVDPIEDLAKLARKHDIGLHVDCCLGSFVVPFMREAGFPDFPAFDFSVNGVTSISADTHKFGCAPKGSSVVMFANKDLRRATYSVFPDWPGGVYGTPTVAGSRPGALIAATWSAMMSNGYEGYLHNAKCIMKTVVAIAEGIKKIDGIKLVCEPQGPIVAWTSDVFDINRMLEGLVHEKGWDLNVLQFPASMHICVTMAHSSPGLADHFLADLADTTAVLMKSPQQKATGAAALYGVAQSVPDRSVIDDIVRGFLDTAFQAVPVRQHKKEDQENTKANN